MPYITLANIQTAIGRELLIEISDRDREGKPNASVVDEAIKWAQGQIDRRLKKRFAVPLASPPDSIVQLAIDLAVYSLKSRNRNLVTAEDVAAQESRIKELEEFADGTTALDATPLPQHSELVVDKAGTRPSSKVTGREKLKGAW